MQTTFKQKVGSVRGNTQASEGGHWYTRDGEPMYQVPKADGKGMRNTNKRDAAKLLLCPSVTEVMKIMAKPGLTKWFQEQILIASQEVPRRVDESHSDYFKRVYNKADEMSAKARITGTEIHGAIECFYEGQPVDPKYAQLAAMVDQYMREHFPANTLRVEKSFACNMGYGGKTDYFIEDGDGVIIDFKTKEFTDPKKIQVYDEHYMQLAAYRNGLGKPNARGVNIFISTHEDNPGLIHAIEHTPEKMDRGWKQFRALLELWKVNKDFDPSW